MNAISSSLGYPNIGNKREWKQALEAFWAGKIEEGEFLSRMEEIRIGRLRRQSEAGIGLVPVGDFTFYDRVLDTSAMFGLIPARFGYQDGPVTNDLYFAMARGRKGKSRRGKGKKVERAKERAKGKLSFIYVSFMLDI